MYVLPWGPVMRSNPESGKVERSTGDTRPISEIVRDLIGASTEPDPRFEWETMPFYRRLRTLWKPKQAGTQRLPFLRDSPVLGASFA